MGHLQKTTVSQENYRQFFGWWFSEVNGKKTEGSERLDVEAPEKCPCPAACASLRRQHLRWLHGQGGHKSTGCTPSVVPYVGGLRSWPIDKSSNKDAGRSKRKTPTPCEPAGARTMNGKVARGDPSCLAYYFAVFSLWKIGLAHPKIRTFSQNETLAGVCGDTPKIGFTGGFRTLGCSLRKCSFKTQPSAFGAHTGVDFEGSDDT